MAIDVDVRNEIFRLRAQDYSYSRIAATLGVSKSRVQRELARRAPAGQDGAAIMERSAIAPYRPGDPLAQDPEIIAARRQLELDRIEADRRALSERAGEQERRRQAIAEAQNGGMGALAAMIADQVGGLRDELRQLASAAARESRPAPPPPGVNEPQQLAGALAQWKELGNLVQSFAPPRPPTSRGELDFTVALQKLNIEQQRIDRQFEADLEDRKAHRQAEMVRAESIARAIEGAAPILVAAAQKWLEERPQTGATPALALVDGSGGVEVRGLCPNCSKPIALTPDGKDDVCPNCGAGLAIAGDRIVSRPTTPPRVPFFAG